MSNQPVEAPHVVEENDMNEAQDDVNKLIGSLRSEKKQTAVKDAIIEDLRYKIQILDGEIEDKESENGKYIAETRKLRAETITLKTEKKILERQVETVNESNKRLHNELHELRNKLRLQEAKIGELRVQRSEAFRNYQRSLQTSVDKGTRLRYFLQQLQNEIQAQSAASGKFQIQKEALETLMHEDIEGDSRFWNHGPTSGGEIWESSDSKSEEERRSLQKDVESTLIASLNKGAEGNVQVEKITTMIERIVSERMRSRLGQEKQTFARVSKIMQEAKHRIASLDNTESSYIEISQRLKDKIETQLDALDLELTSLSNELRLAHKSRKEVEETPRSITMTSKEVAKLDDICFARRASQVERLDLESAIQSMERKTVDSTDSESPNDLEILSMKRKMAHVLEEKLMLSDKLIESQSNLFNVERLLERKSMENQKMGKELQEKESRIMATEENLLQERKQVLNLKIGFGTPKKEVENARDAETQTDGKIRDRSHRVELKFVPGLQPTLTRKVETLRRELSLRRNSLPQLSKIVPLFNRVDKGVQTGDETNSGKRVRAARRFSLDITSSGHVKAGRRISRRELTLVNRPDTSLHLKKNEGDFKDLRTLSLASRESKSTSGKTCSNIAVERQEENQELKDNSRKARDIQEYLSFDQPKGVSELWTAIEETRCEEEEEEEQSMTQKEDLQDKSENLHDDIEPVIDEENSGKEDTLNSAFILDTKDDAVLNTGEGKFSLNMQQSDEACESVTNIVRLESVVHKMNQDLPNPETERGIKNNEISATEEMQEEKREENERGDVTRQKYQVDDLKMSPKDAHRQSKRNLQEKDKHELSNLTMSKQIVENQFASWETLDGNVGKTEKTFDELKRENHEWKRKNGEQRVEIENLKGTVEGFRIKEAETKLDKDRLQSSNSQLKITVDNLKNQVLDTDKRLEDLKTQLREHNQTISQNKQEKLRSEQLQQEITELETYIRDKDTALEQKWQEIAKRDQQIEKIAQEKEILEMMIQDVLSPKRDDISNCEDNENKALTEVQAKNLCVELPDEMFGRVHVEDLRKGLNEFKVQLRTLQVELELIQNENRNLENTVTQLRNDKRVQENELALLRNYIQEVETSVHDTQRTLKKNTEVMEYKEKELREVVNDAVMNTRQMESLETNLSNALQERDSNLAEKNEAIELLEETKRRLENEVHQLQMDVKRQISEETYNDLMSRLKEAERKYLLINQEKDKVVEDLNNTNERMIILQKDFSYAQATSRGKEDKIIMLTAEIVDLKAQIENKDKNLRSEEKLRMENMKSLDLLRFKMEKMETDDNRQRERLFSLKSACTEANEAYEIVKKQNNDLKLEIEKVKTRLSERDCELQATEKEKEEIEEQILNLSRTIDDLRKSSSFHVDDESVSPDSALGISLTSAFFEFSSDSSSPNTIASDNAFSGDNLGGRETGLLCKIPTMIENFKLVVQENEALRGKFYDVTVRNEKLGDEMRHLTELNEMLRNNTAMKEKGVFNLEDKVKTLENQLRDATSKVANAERRFSVVSSQADLLKSTLEDRTNDFKELQKKIEMLENKDKLVTLNYEHEASERKKFEDLSRKLMEENSLQRNVLQNIAKKISVPPLNLGENNISTQTDVAIETVEDTLDALLKNKKDLEMLSSNLQTELADLQLENKNLQKDITQSLKSEQMSKELKAELQAALDRDDLTSATIIELEKQKASLENQNKGLEEVIKDTEKKLKDVELRSEEMKTTIEKQEKSNEIFEREVQNSMLNLRKVNEENENLGNQLKSLQDKMAEIEITNDAYLSENEKLRTDVIALSQAKSEVALLISEAERQNNKLKEAADKERVNHEITVSQRNEAHKTSEALGNELEKTKNCLALMEERQRQAVISVEELQERNLDAAVENRRLEEELKLTKKGFTEMEEHFKNSVQQEEQLQQKLKLANLEITKLRTIQELNGKRNDTLEQDLIESKEKSKELEAQIEMNRLEKAELLKDDSQKKEIIKAREETIKRLQEERQSLSNGMYIATRKVLAQQQNMESLMKDISLMNREMIGSIRCTLSKDGSNLEEVPQNEAAQLESQGLMHHLRQTIRSTERSLDLLRLEAKVPENDMKKCQREIEFINKEFIPLRNQLSKFSATSSGLNEEIKRLKEDLSKKEALLEETTQQSNNVEEENVENRDSIIQLQRKCSELESLFGEYENKAEQQHTELVHANKRVSTLDSNLVRVEQKKTALEKQLLIAQEKISNLEACVRAMKDEARSDKKTIVTLETEVDKKKELAQELKTTEFILRDFKTKLEDALKEKEEAKAEIYGNRQQLCEQQVELKNAYKEVESLQKQVALEKEARQKVDTDLNEKTAMSKKYKSKLQEVERSFERLREYNSELEEKVAILDKAENTLTKETELQAMEMKRLEEDLAEIKNQYTKLRNTHESSEKERKMLANEMIVADEKIAKLQGTCSELLKEKESTSSKVISLNEALEVIISSNEKTAENLKKDLLTAKKELAVANSALERRQKQVDDLQEVLKNHELKIKSLEEKKQELLGKYWMCQNSLADADVTIQNLNSENKELKAKGTSRTERIQNLLDTLQSERDANENERAAWSEKVYKIQTQQQEQMKEFRYLQKDSEEVKASLEKTRNELKQTKESLNERERTLKEEVTTRDQAMEELLAKHEHLKNELITAQEVLTNTEVDKEELKELLGITSEKVERLEKELKERRGDIEDLLAEAQAKLNVVQKMKTAQSDEHDIVELPFSEFTEIVDYHCEEDEGGVHGLDIHSLAPRISSMKDVMTSLHRTCLSSIYDNRGLQQELVAKTEEIKCLEDHLHKEGNNKSEVKKHLNGLEKSKAKLEHEVNRLRRQLGALKVKTLELEKKKDDEVAQMKGENIYLGRDLSNTKDALEAEKAKLKTCELEKERQLKDLEASHKQIGDGEVELEESKQQLHTLQENNQHLKRRIIELETNDRVSKQLTQEKDNELRATKFLFDELQRMHEHVKQCKAELSSKLDKAENQVVILENDSQEKINENKVLVEKIAALNGELAEKSSNLEKEVGEFRNCQEKCEELEIQLGSVQATNEILKHQLSAARKDLMHLQDILKTETDRSSKLRGQINDLQNQNDNLGSDLKNALGQKENTQELLSKLEANLNIAEEEAGNSFHEAENLKRQIVKIQSDACADSVHKQLEIGKFRAEADSLRKELSEKDRELNETRTKFKITQKENEHLKKDLSQKHSRESELKVDLTSTNSKLQSYVIERECWEREVKSVLNEIEQEKSASQSKEEKMKNMRARYEKEIKFLRDRIEVLELEVRMIQGANKQQRHADEISAKLALESKNMEIDNLKLCLQANMMHTSEKNDVMDIMKDSLQDRTREISRLMEQIRILKETYHLELGSLQADLKCAQMENMLSKHKETSMEFEDGKQETELLEVIKSSKRESEKLRKELERKIEEMKSLRKCILSERANEEKDPEYLI